MKINEVIRKYRKLENLTQEQIANYLGVTPPAVNKWESGVSYPDITLLAPLARVLKINLDTLLAFNEELTDKEINDIVTDISRTMQEHGYDSGFQKAIGLIKEYPNCDKLILFIAQVLNAYLSMLGVQNKEGYENQILGWYEIISNSKDENLASMAIVALCQIYTSRKDYHKAQQLLDKIPPLGYDKRMMQAMLYANEDKLSEAYTVYEEILYKGVNEISSTLQLIVSLLCKEKKYEEAKIYADKGRVLANIFDLGIYISASHEMPIPILKKDKEWSIEVLKKMIEGINTLGDFRKSSLYSHMNFKESADVSELKKMIKMSLDSDGELDFIREEDEFKRLLRILED